MIRSMIKHLGVSKKISKLLKGTDLPSDLYWYDRPLKEFLGFKGIKKFLDFRNSDEKDGISENYDIKPLYFGKPVGDGLQKSGATTWNYVKLENDPVIEGDEVCRILEEASDVIIEEYRENLKNITVHPDNADLAKNGEWSGIFLYGVGGKKNTKFADGFTKTYEVIDKLPISKNFGFVLISRLKPGTHILPHCGSSNLRFRYHLGLDIPEPDKVKLRVATEWQQWQTGKAFGFDDSFEHEVVHKGDEYRVVLIVDTWNPSLTKEEIAILDNPLFHSFGKA